IGLLPANEEAEGLASHAGLTYGGIVADESMTISRMLRIFDALVAYLRERKLARLTYKTVPAIYHRLPAEEDRYALFRHGARLYRRDVLSVIAQADRVAFRKGRRHALGVARRHGLDSRPSSDLAAFWPVLEDTLRRSHGVRPTHSLEEI